MAKDWNKDPYHTEGYKKRKEMDLTTEQSKELFITMFEMVKGNIAAACRLGSLNVTTVYWWRKNDPEFEERLQAARTESMETRLDLAEEAVDDLVGARDGATARWFLDRQGRDRGYGQVVKQRHGGVDGPVIPVDVTGDYPPVPKTLEDWEQQQAAAAERRRVQREDDAAS